MAETHIAPQFFSGNIVNIIQSSPLIKMVPLVESSGGAWGPILAHGLPVSIINQDVNKNKIRWSRMAAILDFAWSLFQVISKPLPIDSAP